MKIARWIVLGFILAALIFGVAQGVLLKIRVDQNARLLEQLVSNRTAIRIVAASNSSAAQKAGADFVCDGVNDEEEILAAINTCGMIVGDEWHRRGGTVFLCPGKYFLGDDGLVFPPVQDLIFDAHAAWFDYTGTDAAITIDSAMNAALKFGLIASTGSGIRWKPMKPVPYDKIVYTGLNVIDVRAITKDFELEEPHLQEGTGFIFDVAHDAIGSSKIAIHELGSYATGVGCENFNNTVGGNLIEIGTIGSCKVAVDEGSIGVFRSNHWLVGVATQGIRDAVGLKIYGSGEIFTLLRAFNIESGKAVIFQPGADGNLVIMGKHAYDVGFTDNSGAVANKVLFGEGW